MTAEIGIFSPPTSKSALLLCKKIEKTLILK